VLVFDMIEILPPLRKYKYDTWRIVPRKCYIDNSVCLWSCIRNINNHFWRHCWGGSQYLLSVYRLHEIILARIISLTDLSAALCFYGLHRELHDRIQFTGQLPFGSRISDTEVSLNAFLTRIFRIPRPRDCRQISRITTAIRTHTDGYRRCINDFSDLSSANVRTGPKTNIGDGSFKLKLSLINMVHQSTFCGKASEDTNAHLQHFLEICSTFTIRGVTQDVVRLCLFPFSLLGKVK
jgi:hypothetical protein